MNEGSERGNEHNEENSVFLLPEERDLEPAFGFILVWHEILKNRILFIHLKHGYGSVN